MEYPIKEGKYGLIYIIGNGIRVTQTKYGTWQLSLKLSGQRKRQNFSGDDALEKGIKAGELLAAKLGIMPEGKNERMLIFSQASETYLASNRHRWAHGTYERYYTIVRDYIDPVIGGFPIDKVSRTRVKDLLVDVLAIRSPKTVELVHAVISGIFSEAIDRGYTNKNPASKLLKKILPSKNKRNLRNPDPFSKTDLEKALSRAWIHLPVPFGLIIETLAYSGMRLGECLAMHVDYLDICNFQYMVSETVRNGRFGLPKTGKRLIDLPESLVSKLEKHILNLKQQAFRRGERVGCLFSGITQRMVQGSVERACRFAKVRRRRPHDLRHTYASILLMEHYSPAYVQKQLGHHSITMTVDIYGHWIPGEGKKDLDHALRGNSKGHGPREKDQKIAYITKIK
jgi:integrase